MVISDLVYAESVNADLKSSTREAVFAEILDILVANNKINDKGPALQALLDREQHGTTGIGNSVAVPHARLESLSDPILFVGISKQGIDFASLDGNPARIIILLLAPVSDIGTSLKILANIARMINDKYFTNQLMQASTGQELYAVLKQSSHDKATAYAFKDHS
jgi:mannitol/fructose-specific phosphotransferase system IIA component (Ntr-type)